MNVSFRKSSGFGESLPDMTNWMSLFWLSSTLPLLLSWYFRTRLHIFQTRPKLHEGEAVGFEEKPQILLIVSDQ